MSRVCLAPGLAVCAVGLCGVGKLEAQYRLQRVVSGLNQPNYITQAPGDATNQMYVVERVSPPNPGDGSYSMQGFSKVNHMGKISRVDLATGAKTTVLDLYPRKVFQDDGLQCVTFHPDFATNGKMYVVSSQYTGTQSFGSNGTPGTQPVALNLVEEYTVNVANPSSATTALTRTVLSYTNNTQNNHTINWAGFDPTATGDARNHLYISTGDGAFGNAYNGGAISGGRPSQNPSSSRGKLLRVDVAGADAYPSDPSKNFAIPASNPIPRYNALHPGTPIAGNGEAWMTGLRNVYRMSFDRANGDIYMGDVGENVLEEVNFLKAGTNTGDTQGPADFGWPQWEGMQASSIGGAPHTSTNPFTGVTSTNPILQYDHNFGNAIIGGYVYRGEIEQLQGKYLYADFANAGVRTLDFDRNTASSSFNGNNGTVADITAILRAATFDPNDPNYTSGSASFGVGKAVSFGEDNLGNVYLVDFGGISTDLSFTSTTGQYPAAGFGEVFKLIPSVRGDLNNNGVVDSIDFNFFAANYGKTSGATWINGDFDNNGKVNTLDFNYLAANYGPASGAGVGAVVPEPAVCLLMPVAMLWFRRRR